MNDEARINAVLSEVGGVLLDKGEGYSIGQLVADLEGDGDEPESDPYNVWDKHLLQDLKQVDEWRDDPRDFEEVDRLMTTLEAYWTEHPDLRFCQLICNAHQSQNGLGDFDPDETAYVGTLDELTDEQLLDYLDAKLEADDE